MKKQDLTRTIKRPLFNGFDILSIHSTIPQIVALSILSTQLIKFKKYNIYFINPPHVETVVQLSLKKEIPKLDVTMEVDSDSNYTPTERASYPNIMKYLKEKYDVNIHSADIAFVKRSLGLDMGENYNKSKKCNETEYHCTLEKIEYIKEALKHFDAI